MPCSSRYLSLGSREAIAEYFGLLDQSLCAADPGPFLSRYRSAFENLDQWTFHGVDRWLLSLVPYREAIARLGAVYERNFERYQRDVWPRERPALEEVAAFINGHYAGRDVIAHWESLTGLTWKFDRYEIVLCAAIKGGPNANSLGYERNLFYGGSDRVWMTQFVSHEVGTHILVDIGSEVMALGRYDYDYVYRALENLARFYNGIILGSEKLYPMPADYRADEFRALCARLLAERPGATPRDLLTEALDRTRS